MNSRPQSALRLLLATAALFGCGGVSSIAPVSSPPTTPNTPAAPLTIAGNWQIEVQTSMTAPFLLFSLQGALSNPGPATSAVLGTFRIPPENPAHPCVTPTQDITFTGSVDTTNLLTLTSNPFSGSVATLQLQLPLSANNIARGSIVISGGSCALASSTVLGVFIPSATGTYTGTLAPPQYLGQPSTNTGGTATMVITQAAADADGRFPVTASLSFTSPTCTLSTPLTGSVTGFDMTLSAPSTALPNPFILFLTVGPTAPGSARLLSFSVPVSTSACASGIHTGELTRQ